MFTEHANVFPAPTRSAHITLEHVAHRKRIGVVGYVTLESEGAASAVNDVQCGIPGFDHPGTELYGDGIEATDPLLRFEVRGKRHASFFTDFDYRSDGHARSPAGRSSPLRTAWIRVCRSQVCR